MAKRPKTPRPFSDATEVAATMRDDTAVDVPHGLSDPSTDVGPVPARLHDPVVSAMATKPDEVALEAPAAVPSEFDTDPPPPSAMADATVQLPTFGRAGEDAPVSHFADATVELPLGVPRSKRAVAPPQHSRRPSSPKRPGSALPPPPVASLPEFVEFDDDVDLYAMPTQALPPPQRSDPSQLTTPQPPAPAATSQQSSALPSSWIPSDFGRQGSVIETRDDASDEGFPASWIPDDAPPVADRRIPSEILAEAGMTTSRSERERQRLPQHSVSLPIAPADGPAGKPTGTWAPDSADVPYAPPSTSGSTSSEDAINHTAAPTPAPFAAPPPPAAVKKRGGCGTVAAAGCAFVVVVGVAISGLGLWYRGHQPDLPSAPETVASLSPAPPASPSPPTPFVSTTETGSAPAPVKAPTPSAPSTPNGDDNDAEAAKDSEEASAAASEEADSDSSPKITRRGAGVYLFRARGASTAMQYGLTATVRKGLKGAGVELKRSPVKSGFDVVLRVSPSRLVASENSSDAQETARVEVDCRLLVKEQPSGTRRRAINSTGVVVGPKAKRRALATDAAASCGAELASTIVPFLNANASSGD